MGAMKIATALGIVMLVLGFLASALGAFPLANISASTVIDEDTPFSKALVDETAGLVGTMYATIITDIASFADNPDLALAQSRLGEMTVFADGLAIRFQLFADDLQLRLDATSAQPATPTGLVATGGDGQVALDWADNAETDIDFYNVYRATVPGGPYSWYGAVTGSGATDSGAANGTTYYYAVTAVNTSSVESDASSQASATPQP